MDLTPGGPVQYDPKTRDFAGSTSLYARVHWVDQFVALNLTIKRGVIKSAPDVGAAFWLIKRLDPPTLQSQVEDMTRQALAPLLSDPPKIAIVSIETDVKTRGQLKIAVTYQNLLTQQKRTVAATPFG